MLQVSVVRKRPGFSLEATFAAPTPGVIALFGRSGSGKTTLVNIISGLAAPAMYWASRAGRASLLVVAGALALSLAAIPLATAVHATAWWEWAGLAIGACIGALVGAASARASRPG